MMANVSRRIGWAIPLALVCLLAASSGCSDSKERQAVAAATTAQKNSNVKLSQAAADMASDTLKPESRNQRLIESLTQAEQEVRAVLAKAPGYWPLQSQLGTVLQQKGDYWSLRCTQGLTSARETLSKAMLDWNQLQNLILTAEDWKARKAIYEEARRKLAEDKAKFEAERDGCLAKAKEFQAQHDKVAADAKAKRDAATAEQAVVAKLREDAAKDTKDLVKLSQALDRGVAADKLATEASKLESDAELILDDVKREEAKAEGIKTRIDGLKVDDDNYAKLLVNVDQTLASAAAQGVTGGEVGLERRIVEQRTTAESRVKPLVDALKEAQAAATTAMTSYDESAKAIKAALTALEQQNRATLQNPPPDVDRNKYADVLSELAVRLDLSAILCSQGRFKLMLSDNAETFQSAARFVTTVGQTPVEGLAVDVAETRSAARTILDQAEDVLKKAGTGNTQSLAKKAEWVPRIQFRQDVLNKLKVAAGGAAAATPPAGGPAEPPSGGASEPPAAGATPEPPAGAPATPTPPTTEPAGGAVDGGSATP